MNAQSELLRETLSFHGNFSSESGIQPLDGRVWSAAVPACPMHSWASACIGSGGIPADDDGVYTPA